MEKAKQLRDSISEVEGRWAKKWGERYTRIKKYFSTGYYDVKNKEMWLGSKMPKSNFDMSSRQWEDMWKAILKWAGAEHLVRLGQAIDAQLHEVRRFNKDVGRREKLILLDERRRREEEEQAWQAKLEAEEMEKAPSEDSSSSSDESGYLPLESEDDEPPPQKRMCSSVETCSIS